MIAIKPNHLGTVMEVVVIGKITKKNIEKFEREFKEKKEQHERLNLVLFLTELTGYSMQAIMEDLMFGARHLREFHKIAVFSDKKWMELSTRISEYIPGVQVRHFDFGKREKALEWFEQ
ncbi:STAS/SEC14 domain-containing protein [Halalkalibacter alkalisediminis]|uniref:STAS/SEC14 domain-containing protein n=1 Tax=Halalkalibacter alkalisediminis TaxID=935616 RepID=A0ABV6NMF9_9BACI|nr:STAS/SEC14 domain-containing protein [Halalkalibacter alkalisediminis]